MIKRLLTLSFIAATLVAGAQTQPNNPDFENWSGGYPTSWGSIDQAASTIVGPSGTIIQSSNSYTGTKAVQLEPKNNALIGQDVPAIIVSGSFDLVISPFSLDVNGLPYTSRPTNMTFYYTYAPAGGDTAGVAVWLYKYNSTTGMRDTMAYGELEITTAVASYTLGTVNLNYKNTNTPDSIAIIFASTLTQVTLGTSMKVDAVQISGTASDIDENAKDNGIFVYPNPANNAINFTVARTSDVEYMEIYDINGRVLNTVNVKFNSVANISTADLSNGMYFYGAFNGNGVKTYNGKFQVQH